MLRRKPIASVLILLFCGLICFIRLQLNLRGVDMFTHDVFVPLDGAWRMYWGQRPHIDFYTPLGVGSFLPTLAGMLLSHGVRAFAIGQALAAMVLTGWAFLLGYSRLRVGALALFCVLIVLTAAGVSNMGFPTLSFTPAMTYNRHCYALIMLILLEALAVPPVSSRWGWAGGLSTGVALTCVLFTKVSFFLGGLALIVMLVPCRRQTKERLVGIVVGFFLSAAAVSFYFHFDLGPMLGDIVISAKAKHIALRFYLFDNVLVYAGVCGLFGVAAWMALKDRSFAIAGAVIALVGTAFVITCYEPAGFPLLSFFGILVLNRMALNRMALNRMVAEWEKGAMLLALFAILPVAIDIGTYSAGLVEASVRATPEGLACHVFEEPRMTGFAICSPDWGYADLIKDGVQLIRTQRSPEDTVLSLDFSNPFPFVMALRPMRGGTVVQQFLTTFSAQAFPAPERLFGTATLVILPKLFSDETLNFNVDDIYGPFLRAHYRPVGESKFWTLYRRT